MKKLLICCCFFSLSLTAYNQVIKGTILDEKDKTPVYSASVYFNGTFGGTLSDQNGNFAINVSQHKTMPLTISALGYYSKTVSEYSEGKSLTIYLKPKVFELDEVVVKSKSHNRERKVNMVIFKNEFLGTSNNALSCEIENENDIRFIYDSESDTIKAYATKPLVINNRALGYKITYYLDKFEYSRKDASFLFKGNIIFNEDLTSDESKKQSYERKRRATFMGSRMQFFRALWIEDLNSAGFTVKNSANETLKINRIIYEQDSHTKFLRYPSPLGISYYSTLEPRSFIIFLKDKVFFDANGYYDPTAIIWEGDMAQKRIGDWLPFEYVDK
jgi:hypothetical protein